MASNERSRVRFREEQGESEPPQDGTTRIFSKDEVKRIKRSKKDALDTDETIAHASLREEDDTIQAFNMKDEEQDGHFEGDTFVFRKEQADEAWLEDAKPVAVEKKAMEASTEASQKTVEELFTELLPLVSDTESVLQAITRYKNDKESLSTVTGAASELMVRGVINIYDMTRKQMQIRLEKHKPVVEATWEYQGNEDNQVHGPYTSLQMKGWIDAGFFVGDSAVLVRSITKMSDKEMSIKDDLLNDLNDDEEDEGERGEWVKSDQVDFSKYK